MKKYFTICLILTLMLELWSVESNAQSSSGSNGYIFGNYLGWSLSPTPGDLPFQIGGAEYMRLTTAGLFGIGTTTPNNLLHLYQPSATQVYMQVSNSSSPTNGMLFGIDASNNGIINMQDVKPINFYTSGTQKMTILGTSGINDGYVGINNFAN